MSKSKKIKVVSSDDVYSIMQQVLLRENKIDRAKEHFWTIGLDNAQRILYIELISLGSSTETPAEPMQVYRVAILKAAVKMILVHNHPAGKVIPSPADINITDRLIQVGKIIGIEVIDHLIISEKSYNSFADTGFLAKLNDSTRFVPDYKLQEKIKKEAEEIGKEKGKQEHRKEIAQIMKEDGYSTEQIVKLTGLNEKEIKSLKGSKAKGKRG